MAGAVGSFAGRTATGSDRSIGRRPACSGGFGAVLAGTFSLVERARWRSPDGG